MTGLELGLTQKSYGKVLKVTCKDGSIAEGVMIEWTTEQDNEPHGESITLRTSKSPFVEILTAEIKSITALNNSISTIFIAETPSAFNRLQAQS
jgi:hypothetical protein